jgi:hypothetical protein
MSLTDSSQKKEYRWPANATSLGIKEMQIKTSLRFYLIPVRMATTKKQQMLARMWGKGTLIHCWWECKLV